MICVYPATRAYGSGAYYFIQHIDFAANAGSLYYAWLILNFSKKSATVTNNGEYADHQSTDAYEVDIVPSHLAASALDDDIAAYQRR